jgi:ACS family sodium-dependent inorganic phosphate cotransporter-like MFS transporter 5
MSTIYVRWAPPHEKSRLIGFSCSGNNIGNIIALSLGGWLCDEGFDDGWGSVFYIFGLVGIIWSMLMYILNADTPQSHKFINELERDYIVEATHDIVSKRNLNSVVIIKNILSFLRKYCIDDI